LEQKKIINTNYYIVFKSYPVLREGRKRNCFSENLLASKTAAGSRAHEMCDCQPQISIA